MRKQSRLHSLPTLADGTDKSQLKHTIMTCLTGASCSLDDTRASSDLRLCPDLQNMSNLDSNAPDEVSIKRELDKLQYLSLFT